MKKTPTKNLDEKIIKTIKESVMYQHLEERMKDLIPQMNNFCMLNKGKEMDEILRETRS